MTTDYPPEIRPTDGVLRGRYDPVDHRVHNDEPLSAALARSCAGQFDRAVAGLMAQDGERDVGIHTARKTIKRLRATLRLVRDEVGYHDYRQENVVLRDTARRLAAARDAHVLIETLDGLHATYGRQIRKRAFAATREYLDVRYWNATRLIDRRLILDAVCTLRTAQARFAVRTVYPTVYGLAPIRDDFAAVAGGLTRVYRRGRRALRVASAEPSGEVFHDWRKRVKYLRYQMEALEPLWPEVVGGYAARLDDLGEALGLEHDLVVLGNVVMSDTASCPDPCERALLTALIHQSRGEMQYRALTLGDVLYAERPGAFVARMHAYWRGSRR